MALVTIFAREMRLKIFGSRPSFGDVASAASHVIGARNAIEIFRSRPTFGDVASGACHDIDARNAIENFCEALLLWCLAVENRGPQVSQRMFFVKLCKSGGLLLPSPRSLVIPWPTPLAHSFTDDGHVPAENLLLK